MNEETCCVINKGNAANDDSGFLWALYDVYKKIGTILFSILNH